MTHTVSIPLTFDGTLLRRALDVVAVVDLDRGDIVEFVVGGKSLTRDSDPRFTTLCEMAQDPRPRAKIDLILRDEAFRTASEG